MPTQLKKIVIGNVLFSMATKIDKYSIKIKIEPRYKFSMKVLVRKFKIFSKILEIMK